MLKLENMSYLDNTSVLITGGSGSLGKKLAEKLLFNTKVLRVIIYSRDEKKQDDMRNAYRNGHRSLLESRT